MKKTLYVNADCIGMRLDRWFKNFVFNVPQSLIEKSIRKGNIKINDKKEKSSYKLQKGDRVNLYNINFSSGQKKEKSNPYSATNKEVSSINNIFIEKNENFVVINKPAGISVQSGTKSKKIFLIF